MDAVEPLILDLLAWLASRDRSYEEAIATWRTSCPRLTVWEDANDRGLIATTRSTVRITRSGLQLLSQHR